MREWLSYIHMDPADADCFVNRVRASSYWQTDPPSLELPPAEATGSRTSAKSTSRSFTQSATATEAAAPPAGR